jgi:hypothetical protein
MVTAQATNRGSVRRALAIGTAALIGAISAQPAAPATGDLAAATVVAKRYVAVRYHVTGLFSIVAVRSRRKPSWALVDGYYRKPTKPRPLIWSTYLQLRGGSWHVVYSGIGLHATNPSPQAPCDIWPPFSEASC